MIKETDFRYDSDKMKLRADALRILMKHYGEENYTDYPNRAIYECANEWCSKQSTTNGIVSYYKAYFSNGNY
tara:strand:- start:1786 stop:2001 length:216 start_codon:yes stop_codon:yes gene_type:complete